MSCATPRRRSVETVGAQLHASRARTQRTVPSGRTLRCSTTNGVNSSTAARSAVDGRLAVVGVDPIDELVVVRLLLRARSRACDTARATTSRCWLPGRPPSSRAGRGSGPRPGASMRFSWIVRRDCADQRCSLQRALREQVDRTRVSRSSTPISSSARPVSATIAVPREPAASVSISWRPRSPARIDVDHRAVRRLGFEVRGGVGDGCRAGHRECRGRRLLQDGADKIRVRGPRRSSGGLGSAAPSWLSPQVSPEFRIGSASRQGRGLVQHALSCS